MHIQHETRDDGGIFFIKSADKVIAEMTYRVSDGSVMTINHTEVDNALRGQKIGNSLVEAGVKFARTRQYKIVPQCRFAKSVMSRDTEKYADILLSDLS